MTTSKIAVSLPDTLVERARRAVARGRAGSVSAYVAAALEQTVDLDDLSEMLTGMLAQSGGALTPAERRCADETLGVPRRRRRRAA